MSIKVSTFAEIITNPLNIHNFKVSIPEAEIASIVVSSTSFPSEKLQKVIKHFQGEEIRYPTIPKNDGVWKIKVPESDSGAIRRELDALKAKVWSQKLGTFIPRTWSNIIVTARDLVQNQTFATILHGAWIVGREPVNLDNSDPTKSWDWDYEFCYQWLEDIDYNLPGPANPSV